MGTAPYRDLAMDLLEASIAQRKKQTPWEWCGENVVFPSLEYPTSSPGPFNMERFPFWAEPLNWVGIGKKIEVIILKCSQSGGTESVAQNMVRWCAVNRPMPMLWVGSQQEQMINFWDERLFPGLLKCGAAISKALSGGVCISQNFTSPNGARLFGTWAKSTGGVKGKSYGLVVADEVDTYQSFTMEKLRPRLTNYPNGILLAISAMDAKKPGSTVIESPIWREWSSTDRREWMFDDPAAPGKKFQFRMGWRADKGESSWGVKWAREARREDGTWDLQRVADTAHFVTPGGATITEKDRLRMLSTGKWVPTAEGRPGAVGYRVPCFILRQKSFGDTAVNFLRAKKAGKASLRTFILEELAEEWHEERLTIGDTIVDGCRADYRSGEKMGESRTFAPAYVGKKGMVLASGDVQKQSLYWLAREWMPDGSSGMIDWQEVVEWQAFEDLTRKNNANRVYLDAGYKFRRGEVFEYAVKYPRIVPCFGRDSRMHQILQVGKVNAYEGTRRQDRGAMVGTITWDTWAIKWHLFQLILGRGGYPAWRIPKDTSREYIDQLTAEEFIEGKIVERRPGAANHLLDCEAMQIVGALWEKRLSPFGSNFALPDSSR